MTTPGGTLPSPGRISGDGAVVARAPAKVNVHLAVGPLGPDGFHELHTVYLAVSLFDTVTVRPADQLALQVTGTFAGVGTGPDAVPTDSRNLVWRAAELLAEHAGVPAGADIVIDKAIPAAAGLAGGSADAAAALVALDALWGTRATRGDLAGLAAQLGSDVPFSLFGGVALGSGHGEQVTPVLARGRWHWVLGIATGGLSTPAVYGELDRQRAAGVLPADSELPPTDAVVAALGGGTVDTLAAALGNDLQVPALTLRPALRRAVATALDCGAAGALVSGSGPTVAALARDEEGALGLAAALAGSGEFDTVRAVHGPVPGARLVG